MLGLDQKPVSCYMESWDCPVCPKDQGIWSPISSLFVHWPSLNFCLGSDMLSSLESSELRGSADLGCGPIPSWTVCVNVCPDLVTSGCFEPKGSCQSPRTLKTQENGP